MNGRETAEALRAEERERTIHLIDCTAPDVAAEHVCSACGVRFGGPIRRGWCGACYARWRKAGRPELGPPLGNDRRAQKAAMDRALAAADSVDAVAIRCAHEGTLAPYVRACDTCGKEFRVRPNEVYKALRKGHRPRRFCSNQCRGFAFRGDAHPNWLGGRRLNNGYVLVYAPDHPRAMRGYVFEHRLVVETQLGRYLSPAEVVHHRNHIPTDNRPENLELMPSQSVHRIHHGEWTLVPCTGCSAEIRRTARQLEVQPRPFCSRKCAARDGSMAAARAAAQRRAAAS